MEHDAIAVDVVILPPPSVAALARSLSERINAQGTPALKLDETHLPHITLAQLYIRSKQLQEARDLISSDLKNVRPLNLTLEKIVLDENGTIGINLSTNPELNNLHRGLMDRFRPFEVEGNAEAFFLDPGEAARPGTIRWVNNFRGHAYNSYRPHITLAKGGKIPETSLPLDFVANLVALCQLGNYCTCRKILHQWELA